MHYTDKLMIMYRLESLTSIIKSCNKTLSDTKEIFEANEDIVQSLIEDSDFEDYIIQIADELEELDTVLTDFELAGVLFK